MNLHTLKTNFKRKSQKRVGRGGKRGTTSGKGTKGQRSRSGHRIRPAIRDLVLRIPKRRGFRNKRKSEKGVTIALSTLLAHLLPWALEHKGEFADTTVFKAVGLLSSRDRREIKIVGTGEISAPLMMRGVGVSKSVRAAIEKAGGMVQ